MGRHSHDGSDPNHFARPQEDEEALTLQVDWSKQEEANAKRKLVPLY
jgi:hypothetical protein